MESKINVTTNWSDKDSYKKIICVQIDIKKSSGINLPDNTQLMDYVLHMRLITALKHSSHPHLMQGVPEMFAANPVMKQKSSV